MSTLEIDVRHYTYRVTWSAEDQEFVATCVEFPSLSWLAPTPEKALAGLRHVVTETVQDLLAEEQLSLNQYIVRKLESTS